MDQQNNTLEVPPHVLIFPLPFLKLAELLCLSGIHVTFLNTQHIHSPLLRHTQVLSRFSRYPNFKFETIPDGLEHEKPVSGDRFMEVMDAVDVVTKVLFVFSAGKPLLLQATSAGICRRRGGPNVFSLQGEEGLFFFFI
ncbi:putative 7-deoxyloganetin glucosyltransferase [Helianthus annuus]|nr:putative 7-deoxyloganetin glucosyltransferase [Helianthus annuus]KAJ0901200.1 putative 7-deoxyloganetin glucosyltransferase [Helianthus annuus]